MISTLNGSPCSLKYSIARSRGHSSRTKGRSRAAIARIPASIFSRSSGVNGVALRKS